MSREENMIEVPRGLNKIGQLVMDAAVKVRLAFSGSFQCRLATESDGTDHKPTDPKGVYGTLSVGTTYAFREPAFDRVIRFSQAEMLSHLPERLPLREALMDPWQDVKVDWLEVNTTRAKATLGGGGLTRVTDPIIGQVVSLGKFAKFDTHTGTINSAHEAIIDLSLGIGGKMFTADPDIPPPLCKRFDPDVTDWKDEYLQRKPKLVQQFGSKMDPVRKAIFEQLRDTDGEPEYIHKCGYQFYEVGTYTCKLKNVRSMGSSNLDQRKWLDVPFEWSISLTFFRYDCDTLTGRVVGEIRAAAT
jgi:hypothetical protein